MTTKQLAAIIITAIPIIAGVYSSYAFLDDLLVTKGDRAISDLVLLMAIDKNRITILELHTPTLNDSQQAELNGLRATVKSNQCEYKKHIGLLSTDHQC